ncbi:Carbonic anhydrase, partial [Fasciolopsis buskii]
VKQHLRFLFPTAIICDSVQAVWHENSWNADWDTWWHYKDGAIGGPSYWGHTAHMAYAEDVWRPCHMGKQQSPISISSSDLIQDKSLRPLEVQGKEKQVSVPPVTREEFRSSSLQTKKCLCHNDDRFSYKSAKCIIVDLEIHNTGQDIKVEFLDSSPPLILSGGPLSYDYRIFGALIKFGSDSTRGSDHQIDGFSFPAELQFYAFNFVLYPNISTAVPSPNGLAGLSVFMKTGDRPSADLSALLATVVDVQLKGQLRRLNGLMVSALLPSTSQFITYQGSLPFPACHETVTWIVLNQAVIITEAQLQSLRQLRIGPVKESGTMANNYRPIQKLNGRSVRTNIDFDSSVSSYGYQNQFSYISNRDITS